MRGDLTSAFLLEMSKDGHSPIQLMVIHFADGDVFLSDRDITIGRNFYDGIVEDWGELATVADVDSISGTMTTTITMWDGGDIPFSLRFMSEDPVNVRVDLYQTFAGLDDSDKALIGNFTIQDPVETNEATSLLNFELVSLNMRYFGQIGKLLTRKEFPKALESDLNKSIDLVIGDAGRVQTLCCRKPPVTTLDRSVVRNTIQIEVSDNLYDLGFSSDGKIQIGSEILSYSSISEYAFTISVRGDEGTLARSYSAGTEVIQIRKYASYPERVEYIVGQYPLTVDTSTVWVGGKPAIQTPTIIDDSANGVVKIAFDEQPVVETISPIQNSSVYFDTVGTGSNAFNPHYAFDSLNKAKGAMLSLDLKDSETGNADINRNRLIIINAVDNIDTQVEGDLVNVFLNITHWATRNYTIERADVYVNDVIMGSLTKPNKAADLIYEADVSIDHPHEHVDTSTPGATTVDATYDHNSPVHDHVVNATRTASHSGTTYREYYYYDTNNNYIYSKSHGDLKIFCEPLPSVVSSSYFTLTVKVTGGSQSYAHVTVITEDNDGQNIDMGNLYPGDYQVSVYAGKWSHSSAVSTYVKLSVTPHASGVLNDYVKVEISNVLWEGQEVISDTGDKAVSVSESIKDGANTSVVPRDYQDRSTNKDVSDVKELLNERKDVDQIREDLRTQSFTDSFDLIDFANSQNQDMNWQWLKGVKVEVRLTSRDYQNDMDLYVTWCDISVEHREKLFITTDDITCEPVGTVGNRPDEVIQYLLTEKAGVLPEMLGSVDRQVYFWDDSLIWHDTVQTADTATWPGDGGIWHDNGQMAPVSSEALFGEAAQWFQAHKYKINGVLPGDQTIKDAIADITWQTRSRLLWQNGECQLVVLRETKNWKITNRFGADDIRLKSIKTNRSSVNDVINHIDLCYTLDRLSSASGAGAYDKSISNVSDGLSIEKHGERVDNDKWLFHLVRGENDLQMAKEIAEYYLWALGETTIYYEFQAYLQDFHVEKEDYVSIDSNHIYSISNLPVVVKELVRMFGSGKLGAIDILKMVGQSIRHRVYVEIKTDNAIAVDSLTVEIDSEININDNAIASDTLLAMWVVNLDDSAEGVETQITETSWKKELVDNSTTDDTLTKHIMSNIEDNAIVRDNYSFKKRTCFGACGFGGRTDPDTGKCRISFGSPHVLGEPNIDVVSVSDVLTVTLTKA